MFAHIIYLPSRFLAVPSRDLRTTQQIVGSSEKLAANTETQGYMYTKRYAGTAGGATWSFSSRTRAPCLHSDIGSSAEPPPAEGSLRLLILYVYIYI